MSSSLLIGRLLIQTFLCRTSSLRWACAWLENREMEVSAVFVAAAELLASTAALSVLSDAP